MLTSQRKLQKLFIKFIEWGKLVKVEKLMQIHPELEIPWQKAFESAALNRNSRGAEWIYERATPLGLQIDIHFDKDKLINYLVVLDNRCLIKWLIGLEPNYPWINTISSETLKRARKDTLAII